jgi:hypothetical protein
VRRDAVDHHDVDRLGAELGPKADPTTTTYVPRPEWYFFFLFELLRVIKPPCSSPLATIGVPTICMILLIALPFIDRGPERRPERRPIATIAGIFVDLRDGLPDLPRRRAGSPNEIDMKVAAQYEAGKLVAPSRAASPATRSARTATTARPDLTDIGDKLPKARSGARSRTRRRRCRRSRAARGEEAALVDFLAQLHGEVASPMEREARTGTLEEGQVRAMFDRIAASTTS